MFVPLLYSAIHEAIGIHSFWPFLDSTGAIPKQECIAVGCVPSAAVGGGVCLEGGVCPEGDLPRGGVCTSHPPVNRQTRVKT